MDASAFFMKETASFRINPNSPLLYLLDKDNDMFRHKVKNLRKIYLSQNLVEHEIHELEDARAQLVLLKSQGMRSWDWKYKDDVQYLFSLIKQKNYTKTTANVFTLLQRSYRTILTHDDTEDLEQVHLALVEAVHEWAFKYRFEAAHIKEENASAWRKVITNIAKELQKTLLDFIHKVGESDALSKLFKAIEQYEPTEAEETSYIGHKVLKRPAYL